MASAGGGGADPPAGGGTITLGEYSVDLMDEMGRGTYGTVFRGRHRRSQAQVAVKKMAIASDRVGAEAMEEIKKFEKIKAHEHVVKLYDYHYSDKAFWMVMEFCELGDLEAYMKTTETDLDQRIEFMVQAASAVAHMHSATPAPVVHRDIKPANMLLRRRPDTGCLVLKLSDFGLSAIVSVEDIMRTAMFNTVVGTPGYMAPELYMKLPHGIYVDVFALGLVILAILTQKPGEGLHPVSQSGMLMAVGMEMMMCHNMKQPMPQLVTDDPSDDHKVTAIKALIRSMTAFEPKKRPLMRDVSEQLRQLTGGSTGVDETEAGGVVNRRRVPTPPPPSTSTPAATAAAVLPGESIRLSDDLDKDLSLGIGSLLRDSPQQSQGGLGAAAAGQTAAAGQAAAQAGLSDTDQLHEGSLNQDKFNVGDKVRLEEDVAVLKEKQRGYGGWNEAMLGYLGKEGKIATKRQTQVDVRFPDGKKWSFNPEVVHHVECSPLGGGERRRLATERFRSNATVVRVTADGQRFEQLQRAAGLWRNTRDLRALGTPGLVRSINSAGDVKVELFTRDTIFVDPDALDIMDQSGATVEAGDVVLVSDDLELVKRNQEGHGGWHPDMEVLVGTCQFVTKLLGGGEKAVLEAAGGDSAWAVNVRSLSVIAKNRDLLESAMYHEDDDSSDEDGNSGVEIPCKVQ